MPREGEDGGGFWQSIVNYFGSCGEGGGSRRTVDGSLTRSIIPPTIDTRIPEPTMDTKIPEREAEKVSETDKNDKIDAIPSKPYYFVLPPTLTPPLQQYYNLPADLFKPNADTNIQSMPAEKKN